MPGVLAAGGQVVHATAGCAAEQVEVAYLCDCWLLFTFLMNLALLGLGKSPEENIRTNLEPKLPGNVIQNK